ncbi:gustatory and pheromone receptor 32a-like isoform X2 [Bactrocera dorsalis]|uniref:Gustatory receptor n=1 Tax=Bactrocera dorsalis TaxID=27457 RepID=A0A6I9VBV9_BACDO|nr:gustatory and pheromone receptor 32a-like isoform X2 [Bactrocera dorsalis]
MSAAAIRMSVLQTRQPQQKRATAYTLVKDMKWILLVLNVLAVVPIFQVVHAYKIALPKKHSFASLYPTLLRLFCFIGALMYFYMVFSPFAKISIFIYSELDNATIALELLLGPLSGVIILWKSERKSKNFITIINLLLGVDKELQRHSHAPRALENKCAHLERYMWMPLVHVVAVCILQWLHVRKCTSYLYCLSMYFFYMLLHAIIISYVVWVATLLHLLAVRFRYLNEFIQIYTTRQGARLNAVNMRSTASETFTADMLLFYREHNNLLTIHRKLNDFVHITLLVFIAYFSYTSALSMYQVYLTLTKLDVNNIRGILWCLIYLCVYVPIVALLMRHSDVATKEANAMSHAVARIYGRDKAQQHLIDKFLTFSVKQDAEFTAFGFFPINMPTLFNISSAIIAYVVILIQFKQLEETRAGASA